MNGHAEDLRRAGGATPSLRSDAWFRGDDEIALLHRVAFRASGLDVEGGGGRPVVGIADGTSALNPCSLPLRELTPAVAEGVTEAGGIPVVFPTMTLGEDLMKPSAMLYRNLLSMEVEETLRAYPLDGLVVMGNCDKTIPGALMGALSADRPTIVVAAGARSPAAFQGRRIGTGTDLWRLWDERRAGLLDDAEWRELETCLACGVGTCNTMGTASTMTILTETLGLMLPGASTVPAGDPRGRALAVASGREIVAAIRADRRPSQVLTAASFENAVRVLHAIAGSTNAIIHLAALAGRLGIPFSLDEFQRLGKNIPVLADVEPAGQYLIQDFDAAGGVPGLLGQMEDLLDLSAQTVLGRPLGEFVADQPATSAIRVRTRPLREGAAFAVLHGSLAPDGAVVKVAAATPDLLEHRGPAVVFSNYADMKARIDDPSLDVGPDSVLVLRECGPAGAPGMPEWGMVPIPAKLAKRGVRDMIRVTDGRMSGTGFGTVALHVAPEAAVGGPLGLVRDGDIIVMSVTGGRLDLQISEDELARRRREWRSPSSPHLRGWPALYQSQVMQAPEGCDFQILRGSSPSRRRFVEPVIGRS